VLGSRLLRGTSMAGVFSVGVWYVDPDLRTLTSGSREVHLEPKPMQVLVLLAEHAGQVVSKDRLFQAVWPATFVGDEVLSRAISELRRALEDDSKTPRFIQTIPKGGYRLVAPVKFHDPAAAAVDRPAESVPVSQPGRRWRNLMLWGTVIVAVAGGAWMVARSRGNAVLSPMTIRPAVTLPGQTSAPSFSPDGTRITFAWKPPQADARIVVKMVDDEPVQELTRPSGSDDDNPAWSPDGRSIAFARHSSSSFDAADERRGLYVIPAIGGRERQVYSGQVCGGGPTWAPDGRTLVFPAIRTRTDKCSLYQLSLDTLGIAQLMSSETPDLNRFFGFPAFSPDGKNIAFVVYFSDYSEDVYLIPSQGGAPTRLTFDAKAIWGRVAWTPDAKAILFESSRGGSPELWRVPASGGQPERLSVAANATVGVALDSERRRLAYVVRNGGAHIGAFALRSPGEPLRRIAESTRSEYGATFSPDGKRIAFVSNRAGDATDIWVADADGTNQTRLTTSTYGFNGSQQWSPDGEWLAYDSDENGPGPDAAADSQYDVYVIRVSGGSRRRLTSERSSDYGPTWSRDGRWLYFASDRTGKDQIYKMPSAGGVAVQVTKGGGFPPGTESADGRFLYYSKGMGQAGVWRVPIGGGLEEPVIRTYPAGPQYRSWVLVEDGIYYLNNQDLKRPRIDFLRFATGRVEQILELPESAGSDISISPNRRTLLTCFAGPPSSEILVVENFR